MYCEIVHPRQSTLLLCAVAAYLFSYVGCSPKTNIPPVEILDSSLTPGELDAVSTAGPAPTDSTALSWKYLFTIERSKDNRATLVLDMQVYWHKETERIERIEVRPSMPQKGSEMALYASVVAMPQEDPEQRRFAILVNGAVTPFRGTSAIPPIHVGIADKWAPYDRFRVDSSGVSFGEVFFFEFADGEIQVIDYTARPFPFEMHGFKLMREFSSEVIVEPKAQEAD